MAKKEWEKELSEYIIQGEPSKKEKAENWETAIGLQEVDGLKTSDYLIDTAKDHIEGKIDIYEAKSRISEYYEEKNTTSDDDIEEADKVAVRITELLGEKTFSFSTAELLNIHKRLFEGIIDKAGVYRDFDFSKKEWILNNDTVVYSPYEIIEEALEYDFKEERYFSYKGLTIDESIERLCRFVSNIWQVHPFVEGNTRTTAVFLIKYLRSFGFDLDNEIFKDNSWYFRNALVRANYTNISKGIYEDLSYLEKFFYNMLANKNYELKNRYLHIDYKDELKDEKEDNNLSLEEQAILNIIKNNPSITQNEIASRIDKSVRTVKTYMQEMQDKKIIARQNSKKTGEWVILDK